MTHHFTTTVHMLVDVSSGSFSLHRQVCLMVYLLNDHTVHTILCTTFSRELRSTGIFLFLKNDF